MVFNKVCIYCHKDFQTNDKRLKYCSKKCRENNNYIYSKDSSKLIECVYCHNEFNSKLLTKKFCSKECYLEYRKLKLINNIKTCNQCFNKFETYDKTKKFCSKECYLEYRKLIKKRGIESKTKICPRCKKEKLKIEFHNNIRTFDGISPYCKDCLRQRNKKVFTYQCVDCGNDFHRYMRDSMEKELNKSNRCLKCAKEKIIRDNGGVNIGYKGTISFSGSTFAGWKCSAKRRNIEWNITREQMEEIYQRQNGICALSGIKMQPHKKSPYRPSIDRIDSNKSYNIDNIHFVCSMVNMMKNKYNINEFIEMCTKISNNMMEKE